MASWSIWVGQQKVTVSSVQGLEAYQSLLSFPSLLILKGRLGPTVSSRGTAACHGLAEDRKRELS